MKKALTVISSLVALFLATVLICTCEVGLGESVDTQPPLVEITAPSADYIVREAFVMSGTCSDEQGVASVSVTLRNTSSNKTYGPFSAELSEKKDSWTCRINPLSSESAVPDGTYEATVTAKDTANRTTDATKSFTIDNTEPVLVLTRPSTKIEAEGGAQSYDTYGAEFDITGQVADDSNIDKLVVSIYKDAACTQKIRDIELNNVPPTIDLSVAKYGDGSGIYEEIYGNIENNSEGIVTAETKQFYCKITIYDAARHCPPIENDEGNSRQAYYLYNDIYSSLLKNYKITEIYHILNGSWKDSAEGAKAAASAESSGIIEKVKNALATSETKAGAFSLNPMNNPTYSFAGLSKLSGTTEAEKFEELNSKAEDGNYKFGILSGSSATFNFFVGLDQSPFVKESLGLYLTPFTKDANGTYKLDEENRIWILKPYIQKTDKNGNAVYDENGNPVYTENIDVSEFGDAAKALAYFKNVRNNLESSGLNFNFSVEKMSSAEYFPIKTGTSYVIGAVGIDQNGTGFINSDDYGFFFQSNGAAPSLNITKIDDKTYASTWHVAKDKPMKIAGTVTAEDAATITFTVKDKDNKTISFTGETLECKTKTSSPANEEWEITIPNKYFAQKNEKGNIVSSNYTVYISAKREGSLSTERQIAVVYDVEGPVIDIVSVFPYASFENKLYTVNGKFTVKVQVSDAFSKLSETEKTSVEIIDSETTESFYSYSSSSGTINCEINSRSDLKNIDKKNLKIKVTSYDYAGNKSVAEQPLYLDQDTDKPKIRFTSETNTLDGYTETYPQNGTKNIFVTGAPIVATVTDDEGIASVVVNVYKTTEENGSYNKEQKIASKEYTKDEITGNPFSLSYNVPSDLGVYYAEIIAKDTESGITNDSFAFYFMVDSGMPTITVNPSANGNYFGRKGGPIAVTGSASGLGGLKIYRKYDSAAENNVEISGNQPGESVQKYNWEDEFTVPADVKESEEPATSTYSVVDKKGRVGTAILTYYVDNTPPKVSITNKETLVEGSNIQIKGTASDKAGTGTVASGVNSVWYKITKNGETDPAAPTSETSAEKDNWTKLPGTVNWNFWQSFYEKGGTSAEENALPEGKYTLYVIAFDAAQNASSVANYTFTVDLNKPEIKTSYKISGSETSYEISGNDAISLTKKLSSFDFVANDSFGLAESDDVSVKITKDGKELKGKTTASESESYDYSLMVSRTLTTGSTGTTTSGSGSTAGSPSETTGSTGTITFAEQTDGTYVFEITAKDANGNTATITRTIVLDTTAPTIEIISPDSSEWITTARNKVTINGSASDGSGVKAVYYKAYGENEEVPVAVVPSASTTGTSGSTSDSDWTKAGWTKANGTASWKIADFALSLGENNIALAAVDTYGNTSVKSNVFKYDNAKPTLSVNVVSTGSTTENSESIVVSNNDTIFANSSVSKIKFSVTGNDNYNLKSIAVSAVVSSTGGETGTTDTLVWKEAETTALGLKQSSWTSGDFALGTTSEANKLADGVYTVTVIVTDISGQTATNTFTLTIDTIAPEIKTHEISAVNDKKAESANGTWHSSATPTLKISATDATSGVAIAYYLVSTNSDKPFTLDELKKQTIDSLITKSGNNFSRVLSLNEGKNYIYIKVEDNAGNVSYYGADGMVMPWFVDKTAPSVTFKAPNTSSMLSSKVAQNYEIHVTDDGAGIVDGTTATVTLSSAGITPIVKSAVVSRASTTGTSVDYVISGTFTADEMAKITANSADLSVTISDAVENSRTEKLTLTFDNEAPEVKITNPPLDTVNGRISISGTSSDNVSVASVKLYRSKLDSEATTGLVIEPVEITSENGTKTSVDSVLLQEFTGAAAYNWAYSNENEATFDTTQFADGTKLTLYVLATDSAQNTKVETKTLTIDQDADRPVIKFTNLTLNGMTSSKSVMNKNETVFGTVQDDDGVKEMYISVDGGTTWSENIYDSGSWKYTFTEDKSYTLAFKVVDSENDEFVSATGSENMKTSPKIIDNSSNGYGYKNNGSYEKPDTFVYLQTDTQNPAIDSVYYIVSEAELTFTDEEIKNYKTSTEATKQWKEKNNLSSFGGKYRYLYLLVDSSDSSGIDSVSAKLGGTALNSEKLLDVSATETTKAKKIGVFKFDASSLVGVNSNLILSYSVTDKADRKTNGEHNVRVDNAAPVIEIKSHKNNAQIYGSSSVNVKGTADDCEKLYVKITDSATAPTANFGIDTTEKTQWERIDEYTSTGNWSVVFGSGSNTVSGIDYYAQKGTLNGYYDSLFDPKSSENTAVSKNMYIWLYGEDSLGNISIPKSVVLNVNPQGDQPNVTVSYPEISSEASKLTSVGGTIRITGSTSLGTTSDVTVDSVWIQIDPSYEEAAGFADDWETELKTIIEDTNGTALTDYKIEATGIDKIGNAIKANGSTSSWNLTINAIREFNREDNKNRPMAIRVYAYSSSHKVSNPVVVPFELDPNTPVIGGTKAVSLVQYDDKGNVVREMPYSNNMWLSGQWYLTGSIEDDSGISDIKLDGNSIITKTEYLEEATTINSSTSFKNYYFKIPVGSETGNAVGTLQYTLNATEGSTDKKYTENIFNFQYDNKAPELVATDAGYKNELSSDGLKIVQSNGTYTVYGTLNENTVSGSNQSGFSRVLMFFTRTLNGKTYVVDPMISSGATGMENALDIAESGFAENKGIYWKPYTFSKIDSDVLTLAEEPSRSVRIGGICRIDDIDYTIKSVDYANKKVTLATNPSVSSATTKAYFAMAQVIDNTSYENGTTGAFNFDSADTMSNADGDQMVEGVTQSGTTWKWSASIDSSLILDGAITMNFVAFDQAGNASGVKKYSGTISNNAPRIAGVKFGNDDNNNGKVDEDELVTTYSMIYTSLNNGGIRNGYVSANQIADNVVIPFANSNGTYSDAINIKGAFLVRPEIVGGNKGIGYNYKVTRGDADIYSVSEVKRLSTVHSSGDEVRSEKNGTNLKDIEISVQEMVSNGISDGSNAVFDFTLWDYTDGATQSRASANQANSARLRIYTNIALYDEESPEVQINPFYWNSKDNNSVYYKDGVAQGHIELENDLPGTIFNKGTGIYDRDPKVSGTIKIEGTASDNVMIEELYLTVPGLFERKLVGEFVQDNTTKEWSWSEKGNLNADYFTAQIENTKFDNTGHDIKWTVIIDTEHIEKVAVADVNVTATAKDRGKLNSDLSYVERTEDGKQSSVTSGAYKMDVVPYITGISTSLSSLKKNNPSVYSRTALGHYPVSEKENVTISGFNLKGATISDSAATANTATLTNSGSTISVANFTSGNIKASVNKISSLNNENANDASGTYSLTESGATVGTTGDETIYKTYYYNRQPNGDNNNLLTDDVVLDVWEFNSEAAKPINGAIDQPIMKINPKDGNLGFAFANGSLFFSMGGIDNKENYSATYWMGSFDFFTSIGFAYDDLGYTYGTAAGGDCNSGESDAWCFATSRWGIGSRSQRGSYDGDKVLRLERIGQIEGSYVINKQRIKSPSFATAVNGTSTNVYLAYYDVMNDEIRFKFGSLNKNDKTGFGNFTDSATDSKGTTRDDNVQFVNLLAGGNTGRNAGEYVSLGVIPGKEIIIEETEGEEKVERIERTNDIVVAVWYDSTNRCLKYAYNDNPLNSTNGANSGSEWTGLETVFTGDMSSAGEYCEVMVDKDGGIHIAAYDPTNLDLVYAYKSDYLSSGFETCIIDGNGVVGSNLTLDVAKVGNNWTPYIGYYAISCVKPKLAYKIAAGNAIAGTSNDLFTGKWETSLVPTSYTTPLGSQGNNRMNVGVWKDISTWNLKTSTKGTEKHSHTGTGYNATCKDLVYANGTVNPMMGYAIKINGSTTYIETAQMK